MLDNPKLILPNKSLLEGATKADFDELREDHDALTSDYSEFKRVTNNEINSLGKVVNTHGNTIINNEKREGLIVIELPSNGTFDIDQLMSMKSIRSEFKKITIVNKSTGTINIHFKRKYVPPLGGGSLPNKVIITYDLDFQRVTTECSVSDTGNVDKPLFTILKGELKTFQMIYETSA